MRGYDPAGPEFAGREFDAAMLAELPETVDPCGERGEFHTCVYADPHFARPLPLIPGERARRPRRGERARAGGGGGGGAGGAAGWGEQMVFGGMQETLSGACPDCGSQLEYAEGCVKCHVCGYSECG
jgi:hypothetical protein